jgi:hypothetical protein
MSRGMNRVQLGFSGPGRIRTFAEQSLLTAKGAKEIHEARQEPHDSLCELRGRSWRFCGEKLSVSGLAGCFDAGFDLGFCHGGPGNRFRGLADNSIQRVRQDHGKF